MDPTMKYWNSFGVVSSLALFLYAAKDGYLVEAPTPLNGLSKEVETLRFWEAAQAARATGNEWAVHAFVSAREVLVRAVMVDGGGGERRGSVGWRRVAAMEATVMRSSVVRLRL
jgi:hypothetical protein